MKNSFVMYTDYLEQTDMLSDEQMGILFRAILNYELTGELIEMDDLTRLSFNFIKVKLDKDSDKYEQTCEKRREAGRSGGLAKASNSKQKLASASKAKQNKQDLANLADNDSDNDNDIKESTLKGTKEKQFKPPTVDEVKAYCSQQGYNMDAEKFVDFYASKGWMVGKNKMKDWKAAVRNWVKTDKQSSGGNSPPRKPQFTDFSQRQYDYAELNKKLFGGGG